MTASITTAIRADAATSDAEGRRDLAGHLADFRAALLDEAALIAASDRSRFDSEVATLTATRDIVIGQRETAQRERDEARGLLHALTADLNATRSALTAAEAFRDSLQAEADDAGKMLDAIRSMAGVGASRSEVDTLEVVRLRLECDREIAADLRAERDALRAEVDRLRSEVDRAKSDELNRRLTIADDERAEFVLAAVAVAQALDDGRSLGPAGEEQDPRAWVRFARGLAERVAARVEQAVGNGDNLEAAHEHLATLRAEVDKLRARPVLTEERLAEALDAHSHASLARKVFAHLGPVTLPTPDRAAELAREIHRARLARLGQEANAIGISAIDDIRTALAKLAPAPTPSKPAEDDSLPWGVARFTRRASRTAATPARPGASAAVTAGLLGGTPEAGK